jgi:hypothetical protein
MDIEILRELCSNVDNIQVTRHAYDRFRERSITLDDVINAISSGEIIEQYPNDYPYPSCLVLGLSVDKTPLHTVCGVDKSERLWIITAYFPSDDKWENDYSKRKAVKLL